MMCLESYILLDNRSWDILWDHIYYMLLLWDDVARHDKVYTIDYR